MSHSRRNVILAITPNRSCERIAEEIHSVSMKMMFRKAEAKVQCAIPSPLWEINAHQRRWRPATQRSLLPPACSSPSDLQPALLTSIFQMIPQSGACTLVRATEQEVGQARAGPGYI